MAKIQSSVDDAISLAKSWKNESCASVLNRLAEKATQAAKQTDKEVKLEIEHNLIRLPGHMLRNFWSSLVHVMRNAVDHGIESSDERAACGKSPVGTIKLTTRKTTEALIVEICDDGRGIDWDGLKAKAISLGMSHRTRADLVEVLLCDGVSTRETVTELSGRGVGMAAVREAVEDLDGTLKVKSKPGRGCRFVFEIPLSTIDSSVRDAVNYA